MNPWLEFYSTSMFLVKASISLNKEMRKSYPQGQKWPALKGSRNPLKLLFS